MSLLRRIKDWATFQHYQSGKNAKKPEWIKLYRRLLDDIEWHNLDPVAAKTLISLWLLASENGGTLPRLDIIAFRLRMPEKQIKSVLSMLPHWIENCPSDVLGESYAVPRPEEEGEIEGEEEGEEEHTSPKSDVGCEQIAFDSYNEAATRLNLPIAEKLTTLRRDKLRARLDENGLEGWFRALRNLEELPFCLGQGERGWRANLDFLLQPASFQKVLERAFAGGTGPPPKLTNTQQAARRLLEKANGISKQNGSGGDSESAGRLLPNPASRPGDATESTGRLMRGATKGDFEADG